MNAIYQLVDGCYPFNQKPQNNCKHVEFLFTITTQAEAQKFYVYSKAYQSIKCQHLLKLIKVANKGTNLLFLYECCHRSIENFIAENSIDGFKKILLQLNCAISCLSKAGFKAELKVQNIGVDLNGNIKLFVAPCCEIIKYDYDLSQYYIIEQTRLHFEIEEIYQRYEKKINFATTKIKKLPNFFINGNELIFNQNSHKRHQDHTNTSSQYSCPTPVQFPTSNTKNASNFSLQNLLGKIQLRKQSPKTFPRKQCFSQKATERNKNQTYKNKNKQIRLFDSKQKQPAILKRNQLNLLQKDRIDNKLASKNKKSSQNRSDSEKITHLNEDSKFQSYAAFISNNKLHKLQDTGSPLSCRNSLESNQKDDCLIQSCQQFSKYAFPNIHLGQSDRIQITTQIVSKYKIKIIACQQFEFQGKEGVDIQQLAHDKFIEYQIQHGLTGLSNKGHHLSQNNSNERRNKLRQNKRLKTKTQKHKVEYNLNEQIKSKIFRVKQKAFTALKSYKDKKGQQLYC